MKYQIIIPNWNNGKLSAKCLETIGKHSSDYEVIFIDNASKEEDFQMAYEELKKIPHILVRNTTNLGFVKAVNQGLSLANSPYIVLMNNDTEAVEGWLEKLREPLMEGNIGASGSRTTTDGSWQGRVPEGEGYRMLPGNAMLAFFCTMFKKEVIDKTGLLDESFGLGLGDDDDYCYRMHQKGFRLALVQDMVIPHHHRSSFKQLYTDDELKELQEKNIKKFKDKHGIV